MPKTSPAQTGPEWIRVVGARVHNLNNTTVEIPRNRLVVITGLSGSGKSSLAFDTLYAEGQRRYVESLSAYARQFLDQIEKPDVDAIIGLSPAISIEQRKGGRTPRSTVGTVTEIYDYLRVMFARIGVPHCPVCDRKIERQTIDQMVDQVLALDEGTRLMIQAPLLEARKGEHRKLFDRLRRDGFARVQVDGETMLLDDPISLDRKRAHDVDLVVDRLVVRDDVRARLAESLEVALRYGEGVVRVAPLRGASFVMSERYACIEHGISVGEIQPRMFSFNAPQGACPACNGLGVARTFDPQLVVPDPERALADGAIAPWRRRGQAYLEQLLRGVADELEFRLDCPFVELPQGVQHKILYGDPRRAIDVEVTLKSKSGRQQYSFTKRFEGIIPMLEKRYHETDSARVRAELEQYMNEQQCPACHGSKLRPEATAVKIEGEHIGQVTARTVHDARDWFEQLRLGARDRAVAERVLNEVRERLRFLDDVGLGYLTLDRRAVTLSGGEEQRIRLATQLGNALTGVLYILDEPSIGLHAADHAKLLATLKRLRDRGNTVIVVEHDDPTIRAADWVVDLGPGAGIHGGDVVASGPPAEIENAPESLTGAYLAGLKQVPVPERRRQPSGWVTVHGARGNNLKRIDGTFARGAFNVVTGVSGSGKSTLVLDTLYAAARNKLHKRSDPEAPNDGITGLGGLKKVIEIDQAPIGRTPRSNPATYVDLFTPIRQLFAGVPEARVRGYTAGRFSFNVKGGRCEACEGAGVMRIEMHFLPDVFVTCDVCNGTRYNRESLEVRYKGKNIAEVLDLTIEEAATFFAPVPVLRRKLQLLTDVGLGYLQLGQRATTLSGGEAQRIKLAKELSRASSGDALYILDEPTTGLHVEDVRKLLLVLNRLVDTCNTVVVIEHHLDVIKCADYVVDLGPTGGAHGGEIIAAGTPETVAGAEASATGRFLRELLQPATAGTAP